MSGDARAFARPARDTATHARPTSRRTHASHAARFVPTIGDPRYGSRHVFDV